MCKLTPSSSHSWPAVHPKGCIYLGTMGASTASGHRCWRPQRLLTESTGNGCSMQDRFAIRQTLCVQQKYGYGRRAKRCGVRLRSSGALEYSVYTLCKPVRNRVGHSQGSAIDVGMVLAHLEPQSNQKHAVGGNTDHEPPSVREHAQYLPKRQSRRGRCQWLCESCGRA